MDEFDRIVGALREGVTQPTCEQSAAVRPFEIGLYDFERRAFETTALFRRYVH